MAARARGDPFLPAGSAPDGFADSYTLSGCSTAAHCGVFGRVAAQCTDPTGYGHCPGGDYARPGWTDATLCDGAPVYQRQGGGADGAVLVRWRPRLEPTTRTFWVVGSSAALADCGGYYYPSNSRNYCYGGYFSSVPIPGPPSYAPDAAGYGWSDPGGLDSGEGPVHIVAGGGGGGGGH